ncbi:MAG: DNA ligase [Candidatus Diapherotrites archaeon CG10_big_fil_rev_8_21_14_0_10_31_34]|nr:MAG: DNA ligase [Candidatus Diapherotrites archaeon CG10_big_fil_rev_8_21_14_0_10_31_34]
MQFKELASYFDLIEKTSSRLDMTKILAELLEKADEESIKKIVFLCQGRLGANYEKLEFGLGEKMVIEAIAKATGFTKKEIEKKFREKGDLGLVAEEFCSQKKQSALFSTELTVKKVFENLIKISQVEGTGSKELKLKLMAELFNSASGTESRFIARIPLENLRLGIGDPTIMDALAANLLDEGKQNAEWKKEIEKEMKEKKIKEKNWIDEFDRKMKLKLRERIEEKYNIYSDLGAISEILKVKRLNGLKEIQIQLGIPIRPTLAERLNSPEEIIKKLGKCAVESKYDGFRIQCHKEGKKVWIYSRQSENMTSMFPDIVKALKEEIKTEKVILEGEAIAFNELTGNFLSFQLTIQRKRKYGIEDKAKEFPLKLFVFDLMFLEGKNFMEKPFLERRKKLNEIIGKGKTISLTKTITTDKAEKLEEFFEESISKGLEGIIAKDLNAKYIAGKRKFAWIKLKRSYKGELNDSIDGVIIGYYTGKGKRTEFGLGALLTAVYSEKEDVFKSVAKIGTGLTDKNLAELEKILKKISSKKKPARVQSELEPDFWVEPKYVIEIRADEITKSPVHLAAKREGKGLALRFPRLISIRTDKKPEEATNETELKKMFAQQKQINEENQEQNY